MVVTLGYLTNIFGGQPIISHPDKPCTQTLELLTLSHEIMSGLDSPLVPFPSLFTYLYFFANWWYDIRRIFLRNKLPASWQIYFEILSGSIVLVLYSFFRSHIY